MANVAGWRRHALTKDCDHNGPLNDRRPVNQSWEKGVGRLRSPHWIFKRGKEKWLTHDCEEEVGKEGDAVGSELR